MTPFQYQPPQAAGQGKETATSAEKEVMIPDEKEVAYADGLEVVAAIPARNPRRVSNRISKQPVPQLQIPDERDEAGEGEEAVFILQPRTYTPVPPAPIPSPRILDASARGPVLLRIDRARHASRDSLRDTSRDTLRDTSRDTLRDTSRDTLKVDTLRPLVDSPTLRADTYVPVGGSRASRAEGSPTTIDSPRDPDLQFAPKQRTSLRQRVSLKTTPPESIQVPPLNAPEFQRPANNSPQTYQGPDSAYGSGMERPSLTSLVSSIDPSLDDFPAPVLRPTLIPSPQSDQQYFRPVQASPHSPLQQRPHTSGTMNPRYPAYQQHQRNTPSAMGMSMLSNVTTMTNNTAGGKTLKKKRSAFGWLKKAFSLDEEERIAFEQKKHEQSPNLYYDGKSPRFLDGRRVQPRQSHQPSHYG